MSKTLAERLRYIAACISAHADKFPVPGHMEAHAQFLRNHAAEQERAEQEATELRESDPWEQVGFWKEKAEQVERDLSDLKDKGLVMIREKTELRETVARLREALKTNRDYIADAASGALTYEGSGEGFKAMAAEDLARIDALIAKENPDG